MENHWEVPSADCGKLYFERKFRILYTIDFEKGEVIIEAIKHKDEF